MIRSFNYRFVATACFPALVAVLVFTFSNTAAAQGQGGGGGGGFDPTQGGGGIAEPIEDPTQQGVGGGNAGDTGDAAGSDGELDTVDPFRLDFQIEDRRNQGFVGPTAELIDSRGFVGPPSASTQLPLGEERSIGGNINAGRGNRSATTTSRELQENGFTVQRRGIRSRLRPAFAAPAIPAFVTEARFQSRIARQPVVQNFGTGTTVTVTNRTAVLTGVVKSEAERQILKRQLRLEPGVYAIEDRTSIAQ